MIGQHLWKKAVLHIALLVGVVLSIFPFYWLTVMATSTTSDIYRFPPKLTIGGQLWTNVRNVLEHIDFFRLVPEYGVRVGDVDAAGAILLFTGRFCVRQIRVSRQKTLFTLLLVTIMIPGQLSLIPSFMIMQQLGWVGTFKALIVPGMANAFGIFWMRQFAAGAVHDELLSAGRIDGCGHFCQFWNVALPILRPALAFLGIFTFIGAWNDYLWPLVILTDPAKYTLQVTLSQLNGIYNTDYAMVMAGTLMATLPLIAMFLLVSRQFISDIAAGAIKD